MASGAKTDFASKGPFRAPEGTRGPKIENQPYEVIALFSIIHILYASEQELRYKHGDNHKIITLHYKDRFGPFWPLGGPP